MLGIDALAIVGISAGFSVVVAAVGELIERFVAKRPSKSLEIQIKRPSGETITISVATTGDKAGDAEAVARALREVRETVGASPSPTMPSL